MKHFLGTNRNVNWRKWIHLSLIAAAGSLLLMYQNCAPPSNTGTDVFSDVPPPSVIDDVNLTTGVSFVQKNIELQSSNVSFNVHGVCAEEQSGARLSWGLVDAATNAMILQGFADCVSGGFQVVVGETQDLECGKTHLLQARLGLGESGELAVTRRCTPGSSKPAQSADLASKGIACFYELNTQEDQCEKSCYRNEIFQFSSAVDNGFCGS